MNTYKGISVVVLMVIIIIPISPNHVGAYDPVYEMGSILRGEAPSGCHDCRVMTACAIVEDFNRSIMLKSRWYGWRTATEDDISLIERVIDNPMMCNPYPRCRFLGSETDLMVWARNGWVTTRVIAYCSTNGCSVCVPHNSRNTHEDM